MTILVIISVNPEEFVNKLGGVYQIGRPLPQETRMKIVDLHKKGWNPNDISRELKVTHLSVKNILKRFNETGSIAPAKLVGYKFTKSTPEVIEKIREYKIEDPKMSAEKIRKRLLADEVCDKDSLPALRTVYTILSEKIGTILNRYSPIKKTSLKRNRSLVSDSESFKRQKNKTAFNQQSSDPLNLSESQNTDFSSNSFTGKDQYTQMPG